MMYRTAPITLSLFSTPTTAEYEPLSDILNALAEVPACNQQRKRRLETVEPTYSKHTTDGETFLDIDMPGVDKNDINVEVRNRRLVVLGKRFRTMPPRDETKEAERETDAADASKDADVQQEEEPVAEPSKPATGAEAEHPTEGKNTADEKVAEKTEKRVRTRTYRSVFRLPQGVNVDAIAVDHHRDGVLRLRLPHVEKKEPRKISVQ